MSGPKSFLSLTLGLALATPAATHEWGPGSGPGSVVGVSIEVENRRAPLYPSPDGSGRFYLEAREGARYAVRVANRTGERVAVSLTVDGLNAISGRRESGPGRMYVLGPWDETTVPGWRTSLSEVRRFTFVDERLSYAARSGKADSKMGWIEIAVYRERRPYVARPWGDGWIRRDEPAEPGREEAEAPAAKAAPEALGSDEARSRPRESYPGTGWGSRAHDPVVVVDFDPESAPADRVTLRYEYAGALRALGILPRPYWTRDRLRDRERGEAGFAPPPLW